MTALIAWWRALNADPLCPNGHGTMFRYNSRRFDCHDCSEKVYG